MGNSTTVKVTSFRPTNEDTAQEFKSNLLMVSGVLGFHHIDLVGDIHVVYNSEFAAQSLSNLSDKLSMDTLSTTEHSGYDEVLAHSLRLSQSQADTAA